MQLAIALVSTLSFIVATTELAPSAAEAITLHCSAQMVDRFPADYTLAEVIVHTSPNARIIATQHIGNVHTTQYGIANAKGIGSVDFKVSHITKRMLRTVTIVVRKDSLSGSCRTSLDPV
jgi:hypothetical protein